MLTSNSAFWLVGFSQSNGSLTFLNNHKNYSKQVTSVIKLCIFRTKPRHPLLNIEFLLLPYFAGSRPEYSPVYSILQDFFCKRMI